MQLLTKPLTIEDWLGNIYLLIPTDQVAITKINQDSVLSSTIFKTPIEHEKKSKLIKRIMVGSNIDRDSVSSLMRSLRRQLNIDIDLDTVSIFRLCCGKNKNKSSNNNQSKRSPKNIEIDISSYEPCDDDKSQADSLQIIDDSLSVTNDKIHSHTDSKSRLGDVQKFTFFTCWCVSDCLVQNYFLLPNDNIDAFIISSKESYRRITYSDKQSLVETLKMIEKMTNSRIKFKSILQSRRVAQLLYRKIIIYTRRENGVSKTLYQLNSNLANMIKNAVFYQPLPEHTDVTEVEFLSKFRAQGTRLKYAHEHNMDECLSVDVLASKISKIPIRIDNNKKTNNIITSKDSWPNMLEIKKSRMMHSGDESDQLFTVRTNGYETSEASETIKASLLI